MDFLSLEASHTDGAVLGLRDLQNLGAIAGPQVQDSAVKQVTNVVTIQLQELHFNTEFTKRRLPPSVLNFLEDEIKHSWNDSNFVEG